MFNVTGVLLMHLRWNPCEKSQKTTLASSNLKMCAIRILLHVITRTRVGHMHADVERTWYKRTSSAVTGYMIRDVINDDSSMLIRSVGQ